MTRALFQLIYYFVCLVLLFLTIGQMLDLREKLGVTIQHLIGPNNEQMLLGCGDSTKVHPKVIKPLWKAKMAYSYILSTLYYYATCTILAHWSFCRCFSILWCAVLAKCQDARTWVFNWIFAFWSLCILKAFVEVKLPWGTAGTISNILSINNLGFARMLVCFSLEVSRTESKRLEEANILPERAVTAIIAAVPWLQTLLCHD